MNRSTSRESSEAASSARFLRTHWSLVLAARNKGTSDARPALEALCRDYWYPLYVYVRRQGHNPHDAEDLTQEFFARMLEKDFLKSVDPEKGRFRTFLLITLKRFLANEWDRARAQKRGGGKVEVGFDTATAATRYEREPANDAPPDRLFDRRWALALLDKTMAQLRREFAATGREAEFEQLKVFLTADKGSIAYASLARTMGIGEGALRVAIHRLRRRFRELFRQEIAHTVSSPEEIDEEMRYLMSALTG